MILVLGSSGTVGSTVVSALKQKQADFAASFRSPEQVERAKARGLRAELADYTDTPVLSNLFRRYRKVFLVAPPTRDAEQLETNVVEAAAHAGVDQLVKLSVFGVDRIDYIFGRPHRRIEQKIRSLDVPYTLLRPNGFMQNILGQGQAIREAGQFYLPLEDAKVSEIDARDIGRVAAAVLTEPGHIGKAYELTGPEALSGSDRAAIMSEVLGRRIEFVSPPEDTWAQGLRSAGVPEYAVEGLLDLQRVYRSGKASVISRAVQDVTGRAPYTYRQFVSDHVDAFRPAGAQDDAGR